MQCLSISIVDDNDVECDDVFSVTVIPGLRAYIVSRRGTVAVTITPNDGEHKQQ